MSQARNIIAHLKSVGPLTALDALNLFGCFRLAARIGELRGDGHDIQVQSVTMPNGKTVAQYSLKEKS